MQTTLGTGLYPEGGKADWLQFGVQDKVQHRQVTEGYVQTHGIGHLPQMDIKNAFLQGDIEDHIFIVLSPGFQS